MVGVPERAEEPVRGNFFSKKGPVGRRTPRVSTVPGGEKKETFSRRTSPTRIVSSPGPLSLCLSLLELSRNRTGGHPHSDDGSSGCRNARAPGRGEQKVLLADDVIIFGNDAETLARSSPASSPRSPREEAPGLCRLSCGGSAAGAGPFLFVRLSSC